MFSEHSTDLKYPPLTSPVASSTTPKAACLKFPDVLNVVIFLMEALNPSQHICIGVFPGTV